MPGPEWQRGDGNRLPISAQACRRVRASRGTRVAEALGPPSARPRGGRPCLAGAFFPGPAAPLRHSGTAGRAGGWSARRPPPAARKMVTSAGQLALLALGTYAAGCAPPPCVPSATPRSPLSPAFLPPSPPGGFSLPA